MKIKSAFGLILILLLSACAVPQQPEAQTGKTTIPEPSVQEQTTEPTIQEPETEETQVEEEQVKEEKARTTSADVRILGKGGFDPDELTVNAGSTVTWINDDNIKLTLTFFKDGKFYQNSDIINPEEKFELTFDEEGSYEYWSVDYGVKAKIAVE